MTQFRPMLAATATDLDFLSYPLLGSPKLDGIRAVVRDGVVVSRNLKPIPNSYIQELFGKESLNGLDGELIVGDPRSSQVFRDTTSGVMSREGKPKVVFYVFDYCLAPSWVYHKRYTTIKAIVKEASSSNLVCVPQTALTNPVAAKAYAAMQLGLGYEGIMLRAADAPYKFGRGTMSKQDLLKFKQFEDAEAIIVGFEELQHNANAATANTLGLTERGSSKDGMQGMGTLGALHVIGHGGRWDKVPFNIGSGFDAAMRAAIWAEGDRWLGRVVKFKFFPVGSKDAPRFPIFIGERSLNDL